MSKRTRCRAGHSNPTSERNRRKERHGRTRSPRALFARNTRSRKKAVQGIYDVLLRSGAVVEVQGDFLSLDARL
jgi:hypothetical protein